jgi:hypothetical protein
LLEATQESLREHMAEIKRLKAAQPAPVQEPVALEQEREAFESWYDSFFVNKGHAAHHRFHDRDGYCIDEIQNQWKGWKERAKRTNPPAQPTVQEGRDWSLLEATQESLREHMAEIKRLKAATVQEPVSAQHRFRHPQKGMPGWSVWQPAEVTSRRPTWEIDSQGYEVEYRLLYTTPPAAQPVPVKTYHDGKPWPVAPAPDPAPIIQQLVTALEGSGTRMRSDQWYVEIEAVAAGKFYLNSKGEGL